MTDQCLVHGKIAPILDVLDINTLDLTEYETFRDVTPESWRRAALSANHFRPHKLANP